MLYSDDALIVVDKPAGLLSVPGRGQAGQDCVVKRVQSIFADALVVHRLDQATSGLLLMARTAQAQRTLSRSFELRLVTKRYIAIADGWLLQDSGSIDLPLASDWPNRPRQRVDVECGKPSQTLWRVLSREPTRAGQGASTRLELEPLTGRTHQLRVHLQAIGHPIVGDALYAPDALSVAAPRLMLHACGLTLPHPRGGRPMNFYSTLPF